MRLCKPWTKALIIKLLGKNLGPYVIESQIRRLWQLSEEWFMSDLGNYYYVVRLTNRDDYEKAMFGGS